MCLQRQKILFHAISILMILGLTGCFKGEISVDVRDSGNGMVGIAFGMTQEAKALLSMQTNDSGAKSQNPLEEIQEALKDNVGLPGDVKISSWIDGDYEWFKAEKGFNNLDEVNRLLADNEMFNFFSLTRKAGLFQNEFILEGELSSLSDDTEANEGMQIDPSLFIQMQFALRLPGEITETNGLVDINDPNKMVWKAQGNQTIPMKARSVSWNWVNIVIIGGLAAILIVAGIGVVGFVMYRSSWRVPPLSKTLNTKGGNAQVSPVLIQLGIEDLLNQVNERALNRTGQIHKEMLELTLVWEDALGQQKFISVNDKGRNQIAINGQVFAATRENAKSGILSALKK